MRFKLTSALISALIFTVSATVPCNVNNTLLNKISVNANAVTIDDFPTEYQYASDWIWENRIVAEDSTGTNAKRYNSIFDQIIDGNGTINYVVRWQSYRTLTLEQRQQFETMLEKCYNDWNKWLAGYENWPYDYINVKIVGWAVLDKSLLLDLQPDEVVYDNLITDYDSQYDTSNGTETIPDKLPSAPDEISRMEHFSDKNYEYPNGERFDMYMWATQGFPSVGGCGGDWGQRLSDTAYLNMIDGTDIHVLEHEIGHGFGMTDFYGDEGESDGFPPGGFPDDGTSIMMAGSATEITNFDGWFLRYMWSKIKDDENRFDLSSYDSTTTTTTTTTTNTTTETTTSTTIPDDNSEVSISFSSENNEKWTFNANNANYAELTFKGTAYGGIVGNINGENQWELRFDDTDSAVIKIELPENSQDITIEKIYAGVWDNDVSDMVDMDIELTSVKLYYNTTSETTETTTTPEITTTTTALTETTTTSVEVDENLYGDANLDGIIDIADAVAVAGYVGNADENPLEPQGIINADVQATGNGVNASDALAIQQYLAKIVEKLPV